MTRAKNDPIERRTSNGEIRYPRGRASKTILWRTLDRMLGDSAMEAYIFATAVMRGQVAAPARKPAQGEDAASVALIPLVGPTIRERLDAAIWLAEQRNGKAVSSTEIDLRAGLEVEALPTLRVEALSDQALKEIERAALEPASAATVDAEPAE